MKKKITYKKAGVDIEKANRLIRQAGRLFDSTRVKGSMDAIGGFSAFFDPGKTGIKDPLLVASTDGVGTKLKIAIDTGRHDTIGIDLVAMCVNDCLCSGARPVFFLDYFATGKLREKVWREVIQGIVKGCRQAGCALLGGETAEMPGMYGKGDYDLAGFAVGMVDRKKIIDGSKIRSGDVILGLASSGLHSNGYSFVRKIFTKNELRKNAALFLKPTHIYVKPVMEIINKVTVRGISNITGGGFYDNIPRILPPGRKAVICKGSWDMPDVFGMIREKKKTAEKELYRTFNMGVGMALILSGKDAEKAANVLRKNYKLKSWIIGKIVTGRPGVEITA